MARNQIGAMCDSILLQNLTPILSMESRVTPSYPRYTIAIHPRECKHGP
jgi:hypothetical protein